MQWVLRKVTVKGVTYFARDPLLSYFHEPQKNEIYFLNDTLIMTGEHCCILKFMFAIDYCLFSVLLQLPFIVFNLFVFKKFRVVPN